MTAQQIGVLAIAGPVVFAAVAWITSWRTWRKRNQAWHSGRWQ